MTKPTNREIDCILAALRYWQWRRKLPIVSVDPPSDGVRRDLKDRLNHIIDIESQGGKQQPLTDDEIDQLCENLDWVEEVLPFREDVCRHRDDGRGRCVDCGAFLPTAEGSHWAPERDDHIEVPCIDGKESHVWVVSDENENICYCERCGCHEY